MVGSLKNLTEYAKVAELVDALDLGSSGIPVRVRVSPFAPFYFMPKYNIQVLSSYIQSSPCGDSMLSSATYQIITRPNYRHRFSYHLGILHFRIKMCCKSLWD